MIRIFAALTLALGLASCGPVIVSGNSAAAPVQDRVIANQVAQGVANGLQGEVGRDFGGGVTIDSARAEGSSVLIDMSLPISVAGSSDADRATFAQTIRDAFVGGLCEGGETQAFFDLGGDLRVRMFDPSGQIIDTFVVRSCG